MSTNRRLRSCISIGYQRRSIEDLCDELVRCKVELLLDVRRAAWSQRPEFRKQALASALAARGIAYEHMREAGNPFRPPRGAPLAVAKCAEQYRGHLASCPGVVEQVAATLRQQRTAVFCFEGHHHECHRSVLLEAVSRHSGVSVSKIDNPHAPLLSEPRAAKPA